MGPRFSGQASGVFSRVPEQLMPKVACQVLVGDASEGVFFEGFARKKFVKFI